MGKWNTGIQEEVIGTDRKTGNINMIEILVSVKGLGALKYCLFSSLGGQKSYRGPFPLNSCTFMERSLLDKANSCRVVEL